MTIHKDRPPAVAGKFYASNKVELSNMLISLFKGTATPAMHTTRAIISPHAGYVFSGKTAAHAFSQISSNADFKHIFIIASSHHTRFRGASIYNRGNYTTPLGEVIVDTTLVHQLIDANDIFSYQKEAHTKEHAIEVQLPFLQHHLIKPFKIIPIVIGTDSKEDCKKIAAGLVPFFTPDNLFIVSTDLSHYPKYDDATKIDSETIEAITANNSETFLTAIKKTMNRGTPQLQTAICGWTSVLTLIYITESNTNVSFNKIEYCNSGDNKQYGDKTSVVGYGAISVTEDHSENFNINTKDQANLLNLARTTLTNYFTNAELESDIPSPLSQLKTGAFVTLYANNKLKGCIGCMHSNTPLTLLIPELTLAAALHDSRFSPVKANEINDLKIEISILSPLERIYTADKLTLGKHGMYIKHGLQSGTFLPQVATETGWTKEEFLGYCSTKKTGLSWNGWKEAKLYIYQVLAFKEE